MGKARRHEHTWPFQGPVKSFVWLEVEWVWKQPEMIQSLAHSNTVCCAKEFGCYSKCNQN